MGLTRILFLFLFMVISGASAGFVQDNQNIFYGPSQSAPISYQSFVNFDKFSPSSDYNSFGVHSSKPRGDGQSVGLFKAADYEEEVAYNEEVESAHRVALVKRSNNTDAAYVEAYTEALKAQRKTGSSDGVENSYNSHLQQHRQFGYNPEYPNSQLSVAASKGNNYRSGYENGGNGEYYLTANDESYDLRKSVEYVVPQNYDFNGNGVVHQQAQSVADKSEVQVNKSLDYQ